MNSEQLREQVRNILLMVWDPLCVGDNPNLADEYDKYIPLLLSSLQQAVDQTLIAVALRKIEQNEFGIQSPSPGIARAAADIWSLRSQG